VEHCRSNDPQPRRLICYRSTSAARSPLLRHALGFASRNLAGYARRQVLSEPATATDQSPKLARLLVRELQDCRPVLRSSITMPASLPAMTSKGLVVKVTAICAPSLTSSGEHSSPFTRVPQGSHEPTLTSSFHCAHFTFTQSHLPDLYGECFRFDTMPSSPRWRHSASNCSPFLKGSEWRTASNPTRNPSAHVHHYRIPVAFAQPGAAATQPNQSARETGLPEL
jgi:hypothetical protein